ncbi:MAG: lipid A deacylase LpxR family protein [Alphaproteobacteria bacterium]|nr:lipid A deacylase LpxR family protein [Alphaproteobacteria bacterium]
MKQTCFICAAILLMVLFFSAPAAAREGESFQERLPTDAFLKHDTFLMLTFENDLFGSGTDKNYTSGVRGTWYDFGTKVPGFVNWLADLVPGMELNETASTYYSLGHNLYTPEDISAVEPDPSDRPYAAFLYVSAGLSNVTRNHIDDLELTLGVIGPWALGEEIQKFIHDLVDADEPMGWDSQLRNEPAVILSWQRRWPEAWRATSGGVYMRLMPHVGLSLGNIYTYAAGGVTFQLVPEQDKWQSQPLRVKPAIPGSGIYAVAERRFAWSLFAGFEGRVVARNIFLDGNTFRNSASVPKKELVLDASAGVSLTYGRLQISYTLNWRSKEFDGQNGSSLFGGISAGYRF